MKRAFRDAPHPLDALRGRIARYEHELPELRIRLRELTGELVAARERRLRARQSGDRKAYEDALVAEQHAQGRANSADADVVACLCAIESTRDEVADMQRLPEEFSRFRPDWDCLSPAQRDEWGDDEAGFRRFAANRAADEGLIFYPRWDSPLLAERPGAVRVDPAADPLAARGMPNGTR